MLNNRGDPFRSFFLGIFHYGRTLSEQEEYDPLDIRSHLSLNKLLGNTKEINDEKKWKAEQIDDITCKGRKNVWGKLRGSGSKNNAFLRISR